jgi:hypothetical protein
MPARLKRVIDDNRELSPELRVKDPNAMYEIAFIRHCQLVE